MIRNTHGVYCEFNDNNAISKNSKQKVTQNKVKKKKTSDSKNNTAKVHMECIAQCIELCVVH